MDQYQGKTAVILGGTSGIGLATAKMLVERGARVLVTGRSQAGLESTRTELGESALVVSSDAGSLKDIDALAERAKDAFGALDLLFLNAGAAHFAPFEQTTEVVYDEMFDVNAKGAFFTVLNRAEFRGGHLG